MERGKERSHREMERGTQREIERGTWREMAERHQRQRHQREMKITSDELHTMISTRSMIDREKRVKRKG